MNILLIKEHDYNGFFIKSTPLDTPIEVKIVGIHAPVDPGFVCVKYPDGRLRDVPAFTLENCPDFDFGGMLSEEQIEEREQCGFLFGTGSTKERTLIPYEQCLLK